MTSVCVLDRGADAGDWLKGLPDCPPTHSVLPGPYNLGPFLFWGGLAVFIVTCILIGGIYALRIDFKKRNCSEMWRHDAPDLVQKMGSINKRVDKLEALKLDSRVNQIEHYVSGGP